MNLNKKNQSVKYFVLNISDFNIYIEVIGSNISVENLNLNN